MGRYLSINSGRFVLSFALAAAALLIATAAAADEPSWFSRGLFSIDAGTSSKGKLSADNCRSCHSTVYQDWESSRHAAAWTNPVFQEGFTEDRHDRCIFCHAPLTEQFDEIKGKSGARIVHEGINCAACHVRDGKIFSPEGATNPAHPVENNNEMADARFCAGCHQFNFAKKLHGGIVTQSLAAQNTYREWLSYRSKGGVGSCQTCHMPGGRHLFRGAHDENYLKQAIQVRVTKAADRYAFFVKAEGTGHNFPTGDVFRYLTLEVLAPGETSFRTVARFGRRFTTVRDEATGNTIQKLVEDTSLAPLEERRIDVRSAGPLRYRVRYSYISESGQRRTRLKAEDVAVTLVEETTAD
jgi:hypothetical protein